MQNGPPAGPAKDVEARIREFIRAEILFEDPSADLTDESPLLNGVLDSLALMQLVAFLEEEFEVEIDDSDITREHFRSVNAIARLLRQEAGAL